MTRPDTATGPIFLRWAGIEVRIGTLTVTFDADGNGTADVQASEEGVRLAVDTVNASLSRQEGTGP